MQFTPDARRILTGSTSGEFTLWNGLTFNFETILQAHDTAVRALAWSHSGQWLLSADNAGVIKYFQGNMNNLQIFQGHNESIRDASWAPNDERFVTGADDGVIKIWNFERMKEERVLTGCVVLFFFASFLCLSSSLSLTSPFDPRRPRLGRQMCQVAPDKGLAGLGIQGQPRQVLGPKNRQRSHDPVRATKPSRAEKEGGR